MSGLWTSIAGALLALLLYLAFISLRHAKETAGTAWRRPLIILGLWLACLAIGATAFHHVTTSRRALEARIAELRTDATKPGSVLACLDAVTNAAIEEQCEKAIFANPQTVNAALIYTDARLVLLADAADFSAYARAPERSLDWLRRGIEADRFGVVAHVLRMRGCTADDCAWLGILRDPQRVTANLKERAFDGYVTAHAAAWRPDGSGAAAVPMASAAQTLGQASVSAKPPGPVPGDRPNYPSAASIPMLSILKPEPPLPAPAADAASAAAPASQPTPPPRTSAAPARRQRTAPDQTAQPPMQIAPSASSATPAPATNSGAQ